MGWEDLPPVSPAWVQNVGRCDSCEHLEAQYRNSCSELESLLSEVKLLNERIEVLPVWFITQGLTDLDKVAKYIMQLQAALDRMAAYFEAAIQGIVTDNSDDVLKQARDATEVKS